MMSRAATALAWLATLLYPLAVWFGLARLEPRGVAALLAIIALLRAIAARDAVWWAAAAGAGVLALVASLANHGLPLKLYPVLVNAAMLVVFAASLRRPPTAWPCRRTIPDSSRRSAALSSAIRMLSGSETGARTLN